MSRLPRVSGKSLVAALQKVGYELDHQTGSHMILRQHLPPFRRVTVPNHKEIAMGTLRDCQEITGRIAWISICSACG
ncbi:MAG: type II toxin-antitoxin system HicA family toxin [Spirochaetia bacterium]